MVGAPVSHATNGHTTTPSAHRAHTRHGTCDTMPQVLHVLSLRQVPGEDLIFRHRRATASASTWLHGFRAIIGADNLRLVPAASTALQSHAQQLGWHEHGSSSTEEASSVRETRPSAWRPRNEGKRAVEFCPAPARASVQ